MKLLLPSLASVLVVLANQATAFCPLQPTTTNHATTLLKMTASNMDDASYTIDQNRRDLMNSILLGSVATTTVGLAVPYFAFFMPPSTGGGSAAITAKDKLGQDITLKKYLTTHPAGDRSLVQGLSGDPTYLIVQDNNQLQDYGLNAICTHLGCVVPWNDAAQKFICPCHGSQYDTEGSVVRGPAPLPLALAHINVDDDDKVLLLPWTENDFRTNEKAWWNK